VDEGPARIAALMAESGIEHERRSEREWVVRVPSTKRGSVAVGLSALERTLAMQAFFMRGPDHGHEAVYRRLLGKNMDMYAWRFAIDGVGDLFLVAQAPIDGLSGDALDRLLGTLAGYVDETYESVLRLGFVVPEGIVVGPPPESG
jgi:hypothetical protein